MNDNIMNHENLSIQNYDLLSTGVDHRSYNGKIASKIGLYEAIILNQIDYWVKVNKGKEKNEHYYHDEMFWMYMTLDGWHEQFNYLSRKTIQRALKKLKDSNLIHVGNFNSKGYDRTTWYCVNYDTVRSILNPEQEPAKNRINTHVDNLTISCGQFDHMDVDNLTTPIPKNNNKEYHSKNNKKVWSDFEQAKMRSPDSRLMGRVSHLCDGYNSEARQLEAVIRYFFDKYEQEKGENHDFIVSDEKFNEPTGLLRNIVYELGYDDSKKIVDQYFKVIPKENWDYRHFGTDGILRNRLRELGYGQSEVEMLLGKET